METRTGSEKTAGSPGYLLGNEKLFFAFLFLAAFLLRLKDIGYLLAYFSSIDERTLVESALNIVKTGDPNPHNFIYGSFPIYWISLLYLIYFTIAGLFSEPASAGEFIRNFSVFDQHRVLFLLGRATSIIFGLAGIYLVYLTAKTLFGSRTGKYAAVLTAFSYQHIAFSKIFKVEISLLFWILLAFYFAVKVYESRGYKNYLLGGLFAGLALSTKYNFTAFLPLAAAGGLRDRSWKSVLEPRVLIAGYLAAVVFFLTCPYSLLDYGNFVSQVYLELKVRQQSFRFIDVFGWIPYLDHLLFMLINDPLLMISSLVGLIVAFKKDRRKSLLIMCFPLVFSLFAFRVSKVTNFQNIFPLFPFLVIYSSVFFDTLAGHRRYLYRLAGHAIFYGYLLFQTVLVFYAPYTIWGDVFDRAGKWIGQNIPKNSAVAGFYGPVEYIGGSFGFAREYYLSPKADNMEKIYESKPDYFILFNWGIEKQGKSKDANYRYGEFIEKLSDRSSGYLRVKEFFLPKYVKMAAEMIQPYTRNCGILIFQRAESPEGGK